MPDSLLLVHNLFLFFAATHFLSGFFIIFAQLNQYFNELISEVSRCCGWLFLFIVLHIIKKIHRNPWCDCGAIYQNKNRKHLIFKCLRFISSCPIRTRTRTIRARIWDATITPLGNCDCKSTTFFSIFNQKF